MGGKPLPYDAVVEYLEATGTQWIDTGIVPTMSTGATGRVKFNNITSSDEYFLGMRENSINTRFWVGAAGGYFRACRGGISRSNISLGSEPKNFSFNYNGGADCYWGTSFYTITQESFSTTRSWYMFAANNMGNAVVFCKCNIYSMKIYEGTTLVRDFIPVRVGQVGYMYDRVSGQLFGNAGTGAFIIGNDVND